MIGLNWQPDKIENCLGNISLGVSMRPFLEKKTEIVPIDCPYTKRSEETCLTLPLLLPHECFFTAEVLQWQRPHLLKSFNVISVAAQRVSTLSTPDWDAAACRFLAWEATKFPACLSNCSDSHCWTTQPHYMKTNIDPLYTTYACIHMRIYIYSLRCILSLLSLSLTNKPYNLPYSISMKNKQANNYETLKDPLDTVRMS